MYPLNMQLAAPAIGFASASDADEHRALTDFGYVPGYVEPEPTPEPETLNKAELIERLKTAGVAVDARWSIKQLQEQAAKL